MTMPVRKTRYTYADYLTWPEGLRVELIDGEAYINGELCTVPLPTAMGRQLSSEEFSMMSPAPGRKHQKISGEIFAQLHAYLKGKRCEVYAAPFDVQLFGQEDEDTIVEPDLAIICDPSKLDKHGCKGAPDMLVEILSPSTRRHDTLVKLNLYQRAGVREFWIVDPETETVIVYLLGEDGVYRVGGGYGREDTVPVNVLEDCQVVLAEVFPEETT